MLPDGRRIGAHLPLAPGMVKAVDRAHAIGASAMQVFADNPTAWRRRRAPSPQLATFRERTEAFDIRPVSIHASYLVNLPGPDAVTFERSVSMLVSELDTAPSFGAAFVNVHIGSHRGAGPDVGIARLVEGIGRVLDRASATPAEARLVLENSAGGGGGIGTNVEELAAIADALDGHGVDRAHVGFCIDVAHAWGAGIDVGRSGGCRRVPRRVRRAHRARSARDDPPERHALCVRVADGPSRASRSGEDPGRRAAPHHPSPTPRPRRVHPRDAGHGIRATTR